MLVKICGIQTKTAAEVAVKSGADFIGFVFAKSKRKIEPEAAATIAESIPDYVKKVGVFVNESIDRMIEIAEIVGLDYIQLHGDETADIARKLPYKVIKAFAVEPKNIFTISDYPCDFYLLDSPKGKYRGGNGKTFNWKLIHQLTIDSSKVLVAGGLSSENVQEAITLVNPAGVDVSSGVETDGVKDYKKIKQFIQLVKQTGKDENIDNLHHA
ncbi:phosphoribosylanthranilate isomerase [Oceanobacillus sp. Castelsardo]|uniref:phosphoribosylanthranilate isomerase n=1 Tax=Oceanobacillus sp. Castelsardo TaxID=1851204 RepID=UPI00083969E7|nr:phosphoribosylanthranilate isomerase [Oceanobacillus sp. Castelsardo]